MINLEITGVASRFSVVAVAVVLLTMVPAFGGLVTFEFSAVFTQPAHEYPRLRLGQRLTGHYTFELNTPRTSNGLPNTFSFYYGAIKDIQFTLDGVGTGSGNSGDILIGNPVRTVGSAYFLSDKYQVHAPVSGFSIQSSHSMRELSSFWLLLSDPEQIGLSSDQLMPTPPDLAPFLENAQPQYGEARLHLGFNTGTAAAFRLETLTARIVPEPSMQGVLLILLLGWLFVQIQQKHLLSRRPK